MKTIGQLAVGMAAMLIVAGSAWAKTVTNEVVATTTNEVPVVAEEPAEKRWSISASLSTFLVHNGTDYLQPTLIANLDWLHLEGRYNYEALDAGSLWVGYNFSFGEKLTLEFTPMVGGVFGDMTGVAPGYELTLTWWKLELYSEGEYVFDTDDSSDDFFYNWSSLTLSPVDWFYFGMVTQRTRIEGKDRDIQRGPLIGFIYKWVDASAYCLDPGSENWTLVFSLSVSY